MPVKQVYIYNQTATYTHKGAEHVNSSMCDAIIVPLQCFNSLYTQFLPKSDMHKFTSVLVQRHKHTWSINSTEGKHL